MLGAVLAAAAADAKENWNKNCAKCHGADGKGQTKIGQKLEIRDYTSAKVQDTLKDEEIFKAMKEGVKDKNGRVKMKAVEDLSGEEIKALGQYVRGLKGK